MPPSLLTAKLGVNVSSPIVNFAFFEAPAPRKSPVCTENPIQVYRMIESAKLAR
jgi:hypothetical protein